MVYIDISADSGTVNDRCRLDYLLTGGNVAISTATLYSETRFNALADMLGSSL